MLLQSLLVGILGLSFVLALLLRRRHPRHFQQLLPYNYCVLGVMFIYLGAHDPNLFVAIVGVCFFIAGVAGFARRELGA